ncbi:hypothetical protein LCGC14_2039900 [marine sediment metagenome]|uniref:Uncharacterized protein n=1 Tax=marine sediment metagenome TaxID=412755 RepID=A0A0F9FET1_9ZZZZ
MESGSRLPLVLKRTCLNCFERVTIAEHWQPPMGLDPHLRKFHCIRCGSVFYVRVDLGPGQVDGPGPGPWALGLGPGPGAGPGPGDPQRGRRS